MGILKFFFIIILIVILMVLLMGATVVARIVHAVRKAFQSGNEQQSSSHGGYSSRNRHETYGDEEKVIDKRTPQEANRKIYADNEGEYVDFEESKEP